MKLCPNCRTREAVAFYCEECRRALSKPPRIFKGNGPIYWTGSRD